MKQIGAYEAKTHLPKFLEEVLHGEIISITRKGKPVAMLVPPKHLKQKDISNSIEDLRKWRKEINWNKEMSTEKAKNEGRK